MQKNVIFAAIGVVGVAVILFGGIMLYAGMNTDEKAQILIGNADADLYVTYHFGNGETKTAPFEQKTEDSGKSVCTVTITCASVEFEKQADGVTYFSNRISGHGTLTVNEPSFMGKISDDKHMIEFKVNLGEQFTLNIQPPEAP